MLTKEDLEQIRGVVSDVVSTEIGASEERLVGRVQASEERLTGRILTEVAASEERLTGRILTEVAASENRVIGYIAEFFEQNISPQLDELRQEIQFLHSHMLTRFDLEDRLAKFRLSFTPTI